MTTTQSTTGTVAETGGSRRLGLALVLIATAQLMVVLDATIVNVALPHIQHALGFSGTRPSVSRTARAAAGPRARALPARALPAGARRSGRTGHRPAGWSAARPRPAPWTPGWPGPGPGRRP